MSLTILLQSVEIRKPLRPISAYETLKSQKCDNILPSPSEVEVTETYLNQLFQCEKS